MTTERWWVCFACNTPVARSRYPGTMEKLFAHRRICRAAKFGLKEVYQRDVAKTRKPPT